MCGVYYIDNRTVRAIKSVISSVSQSMDLPGRDIHPTDQAPVLIANGSRLEFSYQRWGYPGVQGKGVIFNARAENVTENGYLQMGFDTTGQSFLQVIFTNGT